MKKSIFFLTIGLIGFNGFAQWSTSTNSIYSNNNKVIIGGTTYQGLFGTNESLLQLIAPSGQNSYVFLSSGTKSVVFASGTYGNALYISNNDPFSFGYGSTKVMTINPITASNPTGSISIGTALAPNGYKLAVGGKIIAEELKVQLQAQWADYVFAKDYKLPTLQEVEQQIKNKGHLAGVPSAQEVKENGIEVGNMAKIQQEKIEELTLYIIELNKKLEEQAKKTAALEAKINNK